MLAEALVLPGLGWLALILGVAGIVRGFAGFGAALIYIPLASHFIPPVWCIVSIIPAELIGPLALIPRALREGDRRHIPMLAVGAVIGLPIGVTALKMADPEIFSWTVALMALGMVALLGSGWRHSRRFSKPELTAIGALSGGLGGFTGLAGPPMILAYISGPYEPARVRANALLFFMLMEILIVITFYLQDMLAPEALMLGVVLVVPFLLGTLVGARIFDPAFARLYRFVAYGLIALSALTALPIYG